MAWGEWEQLKAEAASRNDSRMQLNQLNPPGGGGGGTGDVASSFTRKKKAANAIQNDLVPGVRNHGNDAEESMASAVKEFGARDGDGWDTATALKKAHETWEKQVKALADRLVFEQNGLMYAGSTLRGNDVGIATQVGLRSTLGNL